MIRVSDMSGSIDIHKGDMKQHLQSGRQAGEHLAPRRGPRSDTYRRQLRPGTLMRHFFRSLSLPLPVLALADRVDEPAIEGVLVLAPVGPQLLTPGRRRAGGRAIDMAPVAGPA